MWLYAASSIGGRTLEALRLSAAWTETAVTWDNQPATTGAAATTASGLGYREWDVKSQVKAMYDASAAHAFTESGVNWGSQPAANGTPATAPSRNSAGYMEWTVTPAVQAFYTGTNTGFLIRDAVENGGGFEQAFNSREKGADNPPQLVITFG